MNFKLVLTLAKGAYSLGSMIWDEWRRERKKQKAARASKEAAMAKAVAHQRAQEAAAISHKVRPVTASTPSVVQLRPPPKPR